MFFFDVPLTQQFNFTEQEQNLIDTLPYVIAYPLKKTWSKHTIGRSLIYSKTPF